MNTVLKQITAVHDKELLSKPVTSTSQYICSGVSFWPFSAGVLLSFSFLFREFFEVVGCFYTKIKVSVKVASCLKEIHFHPAAADVAPAAVADTDGYSSRPATKATR